MAKKKRGLSGDVLHTFLTLDEKPVTQKPSQTSREEAENLIPISFLTPGWVAPPKKIETVIQSPTMDRAVSGIVPKANAKEIFN